MPEYVMGPTNSTKFLYMLPRLGVLSPLVKE